MARILMPCTNCGQKSIYDADGPMTFNGGMPKLLCKSRAEMFDGLNNPDFRAGKYLVGRLIVQMATQEVSDAS